MAYAFSPASSSKTTSTFASPSIRSTARRPSVQLSDTQAKSFRNLAEEVVAKTLDQEIRFRREDSEALDEREWKFVRSKDRVRVYKRTAAASSSAPGEPRRPMVLGTGHIEGALEDVLYGLHNKTTREMRSVTTFLSKSIPDAAVLATIDAGTDDDPFRYLGIKWRVVQTPGPDRLIKNRDTITLESMGIREDAHGCKYGFHLMRSVDHPLDDDAFDAAASDIVRGQVLFCCIYRQVSPTAVGMFSKAIFDLSGEIAGYLSYVTAAELILGIAKSLECAAAKRLTLLAMQHDVDASQLVRSTTTTRLSNDFLDFVGAGAGAAQKDACCGVCSRKKKRYFLSAPFQTCRICATATCAKCCVKATVFARPRHVRIVCCKACVIESRRLFVDPRDPLPELVFAK